MRIDALFLGITLLVPATAIAQVPQPPAGTMSPSELPPAPSISVGPGSASLRWTF